MKYDVTFSCGHTEEIQIYGKAEERERKIKYFGKSGLCPECYKKKMKEDSREVFGKALNAALEELKKENENTKPEEVTPVMIARELSKMGYTEEELKKMKDVPETVMKDVIEMKENWTK